MTFSPPSGARASTGSERGIALVLVLLATMLMAAFAVALTMTSQTETRIGAGFRDGVAARYVAEGGIERALADLRDIPAWDVVLSSPDGVRAGVSSAFADSTLSPALSDGRPLDLVAATHLLNCGKPTVCTPGDLSANNERRRWGPNNPRYRLFAWGRVADLLPASLDGSPFYLAVWVADDSAETDGEPAVDGGEPVAPHHVNPGRGLLTVWAEAFGPAGARGAVEATVARLEPLTSVGEEEAAEEAPTGEPEGAHQRPRLQILAWRYPR